jgi:hypothetical protein
MALTPLEKSRLFIFPFGLHFFLRRLTRADRLASESPPNPVATLRHARLEVPSYIDSIEATLVGDQDQVGVRILERGAQPLWIDHQKIAELTGFQAAQLGPCYKAKASERDQQNAGLG